MGEGGRDEEEASKGTRIEDWSAKIDTLFMTKMAAKWLKSITKMAEKPYRTYLYNPCKRVPYPRA